MTSRSKSRASYQFQFLLILVTVVGCEKTAEPSPSTTTAPASQPVTSAPAGEVVEGSPGMVRYVDRGAGFSIEFPKEWKSEPVPAPVIVKYNSPKLTPADGFLENAYVMKKRMIKGTTLDMQLNYLREKIKTVAPEGQFEESSEMKVAGERCVWLIVNYVINGTKCRSVRYLFLRDQDLYEITCTCEPSSLQAYRSTFDKIANSFRFL